MAAQPVARPTNRYIYCQIYMDMSHDCTCMLNTNIFWCLFLFVCLIFSYDHKQCHNICWHKVHNRQLVGFYFERKHLNVAQLVMLPQDFDIFHSVAVC